MIQPLDPAYDPRLRDRLGNHPMDLTAVSLGKPVDELYLHGHNPAMAVAEDLTKLFPVVPLDLDASWAASMLNQMR